MRFRSTVPPPIALAELVDPERQQAPPLVGDLELLVVLIVEPLLAQS